VPDDTKVIGLVEQIDYDFSTIDANIPRAVTPHFVARTKQFGGKVKCTLENVMRQS
jgi:hypothetical protein